MSIIVRNIACMLVIPITVFGLYIILHGHLTPGGGFPGGAVMATLIALILIAFGKGFSGKLLRKDYLLGTESLGLLAFAALALLGLGATFFRNFLSNSGHLFGSDVLFGPNPGDLGTGGVIPLMNLAVGIEVFAALSLILLLMFTAIREEDND